MKIRWVRLSALTGAAAWCCWWWMTATPVQAGDTLLVTTATFRGYHAALLIGPAFLLVFTAWLSWPLARPRAGVA